MNWGGAGLIALSLKCWILLPFANIGLAEAFIQGFPIPLQKQNKNFALSNTMSFAQLILKKTLDQLHMPCVFFYPFNFYFLCLHCPHSCCPFTCVHLGCHTSHLSFSECTLTCLVSMSLTLLHYMRRVTCSVLSLLRIPLDSIQIPSQCAWPPFTELETSSSALL